MKQSQDGSPLRIYLTIEVQVTLTRMTDDDMICFHAIMVSSSRDECHVSPPWCTLDTEIWSVDKSLGNGTVSDGPLKMLYIGHVH